MEKLVQIKPVYLYLLSGLFFILSRESEEGSVFSYLFLSLGIIMFVLAVVKYFRS